MKLLYIPLPTATPETDDLYKAFRKRCEVKWYWDMDAGWMDRYYPDMVYIHSGATPNAGFIRSRYPKAIITQWTGDYRPEGFDYYREAGKYCDINFKADTANLYPELNCKFLPHGVADWQFREINPEAKGIIFIGNAYTHLPGGKERYELCQELSKRNDFTWVGTGGNPSHIPFTEIPDWYNRHKFAISANLYYDAPSWCGNRPLMAMAAGCCVFIRHFPRMISTFENADGYIAYADNEHLIDMLDNIESTNDAEEIQHIIFHGQQLIRDNFTYDKIVDSYLKQL
jgi:hypothetical protein